MSEDNQERTLADLTVEEHLAQIRKHQPEKKKEIPKVALSRATVEHFVRADRGEVEIVKDAELAEEQEGDEAETPEDDNRDDGGTAVAA